MKIKPRKWQEQALAEWDKKRSGILKVVTGGGKTILAILCINKILKEHPDKKILILVPSIFLLDQWELELEKFLGNKFPTAICGGGSKIQGDPKIIISTMDSASKAINFIEKTEDYFLIVDECHRVGAEKRSQPIKNKWFATLGLSATPEREYDKALEELIIPYIGPIIYEYDYKQAHKDDVISDFKLINVYAPMDQEEEEEYEIISKKIGKRIAILGKMDPTDNPLKMLLLKRSRLVNSTFLRIPAVISLINPKENKKWIVFCESIVQANVINNALDSKNSRSSVYHTGLDPTLRKSNLQLFKKNQIDVLVSCRGLDEGFDVPDADSAIIVSSSAASRQRIQRMGRVLRKNQSKNQASIYTLYSSDNEKERLLSESTKLSDQIEIDWLAYKRR